MVAKNPAEMHIINTMIGSVELPELSDGSHNLTVCELSGIYDYHEANAPGAPFKQSSPGSSDYVASWTHTVYFTINSPTPDSPNPTPTPTPTLSPSPSTTPTSPTPTPAPSLSTSPTPTPSKTPANSATQQPTFELSPTSDNALAENFTSVAIIFGSVLVAITLAVLVSFRKSRNRN